MPIAIGKSKLGPSFLTSAGARLMVMRPRGILKPELERAVPTRSRDSLTAASGRPTITMTESPQPAMTSTSIGYASIPLTADEKTRANIDGQSNSRCDPKRKRKSGWGVWRVAGLGDLDVSFPLTPTLSLGEREPLRLRKRIVAHFATTICCGCESPR